MDSPPQQRHIPCMTNQKPKRPKGSKQLARALARWEGEGGAPKSVSEKDRDKRVVLAKEEEHILRCLGAAVIMQWNDLPTQIQRGLFNYAISIGEPRHTGQLNERIARFLHKHENGARD
jgi:hypothetical protein